MGLQLIFCVETNKGAETDWVYIDETIKAKYKLSNQISLKKICMETKSKYNSRKVFKEIEEKTRRYTHGKTKVIYCIDTDAYESNYEQKQEFEDVKRFCAINGYDLIWFCHDVEEVFLGKQVENSQKVKEAGAFRNGRKIGNISDARLSAIGLGAKSSNILRVLDKYLERK